MSFCSRYRLLTCSGSVCKLSQKQKTLFVLRIGDNKSVLHVVRLSTPGNDVPVYVSFIAQVQNVSEPWSLESLKATQTLLVDEQL